MNIQISEKLLEKTIATAIQIQQIPAPTFGEKKRAELIYGLFHDAGLKSIKKDSINNVYGTRPGKSSDQMIMVSGHIDTVFPDHTNLNIKKENGRIYGPGLGDNALAAASIITLQNYLTDNNIILPYDLCFVANSCEEGLGDLQGIKRVFDKIEKKPDAIIVLEGMGCDELCFQGIGSKRYKVTVNTPGGHSWGDYGQESAIHTLINIGSSLTALDICRSPKTSFNIGTIEGGTSINTIAQKASFLLDFRSESTEILDDITKQAENIITQFQSELNEIKLEMIGHRPAGKIEKDHWFLKVCEETFKSIHNKAPVFKAISTDANVPLSIGLPAVCIGLTRGDNAHRLNEYIEINPLKSGLAYFLALTIKSMDYLANN